jgi:transcriptional regulator with XRE-family HTH domain
MTEEFNWPKMIKIARERLGETQTKFAQRFAVTPNTVSRWETGTYSLSVEAIEWLLRYSKQEFCKVCPRCNGIGLISESNSPDNYERSVL